MRPRPIRPVKRRGCGRDVDTKLRNWGDVPGQHTLFSDEELSRGSCRVRRQGQGR